MHGKYTLSELRKRLERIEQTAASDNDTVLIVQDAQTGRWTDGQHEADSADEVAEMMQASRPDTDIVFIIDDIPDTE